ncbi:MAG: hypothetical protein LBS43_03280 [Prevotellaceae bacterium]|jgi:hypothetical protein|nr:hypothetical protein [Prevotellaceae bacterium]
MFYSRINKIKVFNNREGFLGLFNSRAELRIYSIAWNPSGMSGRIVDAGFRNPPVRLSELMGLDEERRKERLAEAVLNEAERFAQSTILEINGVKDNQSLLFGDAGMVVYTSRHIPNELSMQLLVVESDEDIRKFAVEADQVIDSPAFKALFAAVETTLAVASPAISGIVAVGGVVVNLIRQKLRANKDDLVGYWVASLNRAEHYPHGLRDKQDVYDTTGNILVDYTLFGS